MGVRCQVSKSVSEASSVPVFSRENSHEVPNKLKTASWVDKTTTQFDKTTSRFDKTATWFRVFVTQIAQIHIYIVEPDGSTRPSRSQRYTVSMESMEERERMFFTKKPSSPAKDNQVVQFSVAMFVQYIFQYIFFLFKSKTSSFLNYLLFF